MILILALFALNIPLLLATEAKVSSICENIPASYRERVNDAFRLFRLKNDATMEDLKRAYTMSTFNIFLNDVKGYNTFEKIDKMEKEYAFLMDLMKAEYDSCSDFEDDDGLEQGKKIEIDDDKTIIQVNGSENYENEANPILPHYTIKNAFIELTIEDKGARQFQNIYDPIQVQENEKEHQEHQEEENNASIKKEKDKKSTKMVKSKLFRSAKNPPKSIMTVRLEVHLTPSDLKLINFKKEFYHSIGGGPRIPIKLRIKSFSPVGNINSIRNTIFVSFQEATSNRADRDFVQYKVIQYINLETEDNLITRNHFMSRLKNPDGVSLH